VWRDLRHVAALAAGLMVALTLSACGGGKDEGPEPARMTVKQAAGPSGLPELLVTVTGDARPGTKAGAVALVCMDGRGDIVTAGRYPWPLQTDGPGPGSHIHQPASSRELRRVARCKLDTRPPLTARPVLR